jgi:hypothetical protein
MSTSRWFYYKNISRCMVLWLSNCHKVNFVLSSQNKLPSRLVYKFFDQCFVRIYDIPVCVTCSSYITLIDLIPKIFTEEKNSGSPYCVISSNFLLLQIQIFFQHVVLKHTSSVALWPSFLPLLNKIQTKLYFCRLWFLVFNEDRRLQFLLIQ